MEDQNSKPGTYRKDLNFIQTECWDKNGSRMVNEKIVSNLEFFLHRIQFWRFEKYKSFNVLRERWLDYNWKKEYKPVWWHIIVDKLFRKKYKN